MTDRQEIIINGVDVSGCDNFRDGYCCPGTGVSYKCDTNCQYACCVYKERLQRKTAECEELRAKLEAGRNFVERVQDGKSRLYDAWRKQLDKSNICKQAIEPFNDEYFKGLDTKQIAELAKKSISLTTENRKLQNTINEIEKYCNDQICLTGDLPFMTTESDILDIIGKVKGELK